MVVERKVETMVNCSILMQRKDHNNGLVLYITLHDESTLFGQNRNKDFE